MTIPFTKAHGAKNDFLLTWAGDVNGIHLPAAAVAICDRHTGVGADGWLIVSPGEGDVNGRIRLFNPDGGEVEMSGNGTRCAAALLIEAGLADETVRIVTGAGLKHLALLSRSGRLFEFEMNMGTPQVNEGELRVALPVAGGTRDVAILNVGNPQCAVFVDSFDFDWRSLGSEIERHPRFPKRTNVSFVKALDAAAIDVRFFERGAGETMSSGTGSTGAAAAAILRGLVTGPVRVETPAGPLDFRWDGGAGPAFLTGPAQLVATGDFFLE